MNLSGKVTTTAELEAVIREGFSRPSTRNVITKLETKTTERQGQPAVEYQVEYEDHGAVIPGVKLLAAYIRGIAILHPTLAGTYVDANYSERGLPEEISRRMMDPQGPEFIAGVSLYDAPGRRTKVKYPSPFHSLIFASCNARMFFRSFTFSIYPNLSFQ
jgi:hypothetical protein